jgi:hypothetical protein
MSQGSRKDAQNYYIKGNKLNCSGYTIHRHQRTHVSVRSEVYRNTLIEFGVAMKLG